MRRFSPAPRRAFFSFPNVEPSYRLQHSSGPRENIHHQAEFSKFKGEAVVTKQEDHIVHGVITSPRAKENFIGAITMDNKQFFYADQDGILDGDFVDNDKLYTVYRHVTPSDTVIAIGVWTRKK
jgi:hypothetical protein